ncbi:septum formation initiator family protein [Virgibacillus soli]|uniref:Septum formation initiator family protein n=1 Tax=Paracerasibacillus soli TaxID=480284 RepID=A0ABU5CUM1_9BACI|nr:septum formation initiator family protein [Virgibacillus soli]MDY0410011.1 septum formation initiator family protein [Virgibacillus soli]
MSDKRKMVTRLDSHYMKQYDAYMERQRKKRQRLIRRLVFFAVVVMLAVSTVTVYHLKQRDLRQVKSEQFEKLQDELVNLQNQEKELQEEIELLNDEEYILDIARTHYFFSKKGEVIFKSNEEDSSY